MKELTSYERVQNTLHHRPVDQVPCFDAPWDETEARWKREGGMAPDADMQETLDADIRMGWNSINNTANLDFTPRVLEETAETILTLDGNGATLRKHKLHASTPEHVDFAVKDRAAWEASIKPHLLVVDRRRIPFEEYRRNKRIAAERRRFFLWLNLAPIEQIHPMCGHETMLLNMALDPDWIRDMVMTYVDFSIRHMETLFAEAGKPDGVFLPEDMGFKGKPFMSPTMYEEIIQPGHRRLFGWVHGQGLKVILHSCGFVEPLVPGLIAAGIDCLQPMEVKAGMDVRRLFDRFGDRLAFMGNMDARVLISNDRKQIDAEMDAKLPYLLERGAAYMLMSDHSIPPDADLATVQYFLRRGRELSRSLLARR